MGATSPALLLAGAGPFASEIAEWAQAAGMPVRGAVDLLEATHARPGHDGLPLVAAHLVAPGDTAVLATGGPRRERWGVLGDRGAVGAVVVHPAAVVSATAVLHPGCVIGPGAVIGAHASVGEHVLVSRGALVGHHSVLGAFTALLPGANVAGHVTIEDDVVVGMGALVVDHVTVGAGALVAAAAAVLGDVAAGARVQGVPAREVPR